MNEIVEGRYTGEFIVSEANGSRSRDIVTIIGGQVLEAGTVLGKITVGAISAQAASGNMGNGALSGLSVAAGAKAGVYKVVCIEPVGNGGTFEIEDPDGVMIGRSVVDTEPYVGAINFSLADGATDFKAGDRFLITVTGGSNENKYRSYDPDSTDGSQVACALLYAPVDTTAGFKDDVVVIARDAEFHLREVVWKDAATTEPQKTIALKDLARHGLIAR